MNDMNEINMATATLVMALARTLIAQGVIQKEDLLADIGRMGSTNGLPTKQTLILQELIQNFPNQ